MNSKVLTKGKLYIIGLTIMTVVMAVSISFCVWDTTSISSVISTKTSHFYNKKPPTYADNVVGSVFTDSTGLEWLVVDKKVTNGITNMVLMTNRVTETRVYDSTMTNPDYNSAKNNIRTYLNNTWYPTIGKEIKDYMVEKVTAYAEGTYFPAHMSNPTIYPVPATSNKAWLASENEIGLTVKGWGTAPILVHDQKFGYFNANDVNTLVSPLVLGDHASRIAYDKKGVAQPWWTRTGKMSVTATTITVTGGASYGGGDHINTTINYLRPCVQVQYIA